METKVFKIDKAGSVNSCRFRMAKQWTDKEVESEIRKYVESSGKFPTNTALVEMGRGDLSNQICKRGGFVQWAERLGMKRAESDSDFGWRGEECVVQLLQSIGIASERCLGAKSPYDILAEGCLRIDVKTAKLATYGCSVGWFYRLGKYVQSDVVVLYQLDTNNSVVLPWYATNATNITISRSGGIYSRYINAWGIVKEMIEHRKTEKSKYPRPEK